MDKNIDIYEEFPTFADLKYLSMALKKLDIAVFTGDIPVIFLINPKRIILRSLQIASGYGMIFYRVEAEEKAKKISNLFIDFDCYYSNFLAAGLSELNAELSERRSINEMSTHPKAALSVPTGIEPHDGIEYALMQKGLKHVALFEYLIPIEFITNPLKLNVKFLDFRQGLGRIYYLPGSEISANQLRKEIKTCSNPFEKEHIRRVGRLLGYQHGDIEQFIEFCSDRGFFHEFLPC